MFDVAFARVMLGALAGWLSHRQQEAIAYLTEENGSFDGSCVDGASD